MSKKKLLPPPRRPMIPRLVIPQPEFQQAVAATRHDLYVLAIAIGYHNQAELSKLYRAAFVPASPNNVARLLKLADIVGFDRARFTLFTEEVQHLDGFARTEMVNAKPPEQPPEEEHQP